MKLTARIVRIVSLSCNYFSQQINGQIKKPNPHHQLVRMHTDTYLITCYFIYDQFSFSERLQDESDKGTLLSMMQ